MSYEYQSPATLLERQPTGRVDFNLSTKHRLSGSASSLWATRDPDYLNNAEARFPGAPNYRVFRSTRPLYSMTLRSTLSSSMVNELRGGLTAVGGAVCVWSAEGSEPRRRLLRRHGRLLARAAGGHRLVDSQHGPSWRAAPTYNIDNSLSWQKGTHAFTFGGGYLKSSAWENAQTVVPPINLGMVATTLQRSNPCDPAFNLFTNSATSGTVPGASANDLDRARNIYGMLTGRITSLSNQVALDPATNLYVPNGPRRREGNIQVWSAYAQDSWRMSPTVTLQYGLRYDLQTPFVSVNDTMSAVTFHRSVACPVRAPTPARSTSATSTGKEQHRPGARISSSSPRARRAMTRTSTTWRRASRSRGGRTSRAGSSAPFSAIPSRRPCAAATRSRTSARASAVFTGLYGGNPGSTLTVTRTADNGNLVTAGETWPLLYQEKDRLYDAPYPATVDIPDRRPVNRGNSLNAFAPDTKIASARSWTVGFQRAITRDMAVDVRYVGTRGVDQWSS